MKYWPILCVLFFINNGFCGFEDIEYEELPHKKLEREYLRLNEKYYADRIKYRGLYEKKASYYKKQREDCNYKVACRYKYTQYIQKTRNNVNITNHKMLKLLKHKQLSLIKEFKALEPDNPRWELNRDSRFNLRYSGDIAVQTQKEHSEEMSDLEDYNDEILEKRLEDKNDSDDDDDYTVEEYLERPLLHYPCFIVVAGVCFESEEEYKEEQRWIRQRNYELNVKRANQRAEYELYLRIQEERRRNTPVYKPNCGGGVCEK